MDVIVQRNSKFHATYWLIWGYLGFVIGYVVADILKEGMNPSSGPDRWLWEYLRIVRSATIAFRLGVACCADLEGAQPA